MNKRVLNLVQITPKIVQVELFPELKDVLRTGAHTHNLEKIGEIGEIGEICAVFWRVCSLQS